MKIVVVGLGYVGASLACLLAARHSVSIVDTNPAKLEALQAGKAPVPDASIEAYLEEHQPDIQIAESTAAAYEQAQIIIVCVPTDYDPETNYFNTGAVEQVVGQIYAANPRATMVIRSTLPVGFTQKLSVQFSHACILCSPEFLREGHAIDDNLHPSRIVVGVPNVQGVADQRAQAQLEMEAQRFANLLQSCAEGAGAPTFIMGATEAEAAKLFANTYLAMRVAFFNELDTYAYLRALNTEQIIEAVSLDPRIGAGYNNPSFGFGGYCLPKDTKQLLANFEDVPQRLIAAVIEANQTRKGAMVDAICAEVERLREGAGATGEESAGEGDKQADAPVVGIYRLGMKAESSNMRASSVLDVVSGLQARGLNLLIYEPALEQGSGPCSTPCSTPQQESSPCSTGNAPLNSGIEITHDLESFLERSSLIVANRLHEDIAPAADKVFSRDLFLDD